MDATCRAIALLEKGLAATEKEIKRLERIANRQYDFIEKLKKRIACRRVVGCSRQRGHLGAHAI